MSKITVSKFVEVMQS